MLALRLVVAIFVLPISSLAAQQVSPDTTQACGASWSDQSHAFQLEASIKHEARQAFAWRATWSGINAALALASVGTIVADPTTDNAYLVVSAIASGVSSVWSWVLPLAVEEDAEHALALAHLPCAERHLRLRELYMHAAQDESDRVQWPWHAFNLVLSLIPAVIMWAGYQQFQEGLFLGLSGLALGELSLLTQPTHLADRQAADFKRLRVSGNRNGVAVSFALAW